MTVSVDSVNTNAQYFHIIPAGIFHLTENPDPQRISKYCVRAKYTTMYWLTNIPYSQTGCFQELYCYKRKTLQDLLLGLRKYFMLWQIIVTTVKRSHCKHNILVGSAKQKYLAVFYLPKKNHNRLLLSHSSKFKMTLKV